LLNAHITNTVICTDMLRLRAFDTDPKPYAIISERSWPL